MSSAILLGYEVDAGAPVSVPVRHMAVTGQTQESGKTTTLEALATRSGMTVLTFVTKRGEGSFARARRIAPYFRDRADWQFVTSIIDVTLQEKNKFLRPWIIRICESTQTLADVHERVREALATARGINEGVYTQLDAYLKLIVPEIQRADLAERLELEPGINVMDVSGFALPMQMLFIQSALDWVNEHCVNTIVVVPEAWEFIPEGKGSPVKASAIALVRKGAGIGNYIWVDSQDMAGVDKTILRGCAVWIIGVQREANEVKRNLANIPAGIRRPKPQDVANLERGQFFACHGRAVVKTYVQPAWMPPGEAIAVAKGTSHVLTRAPTRQTEEKQVDRKEADALRAENARLKDELAGLHEAYARLERQLQPRQPGERQVLRTSAKGAAPDVAPGAPIDIDAIYAAVKARAMNDPAVLKVLSAQPQLEVLVERKVVQIEGASTKGRVARLLAQGFFDEGATNSGTRSELKRTGPDVNNANLARVLAELQREGFLTLESGDRYRAVAGMKVNVVTLEAA